MPLIFRKDRNMICEIKSIIKNIYENLYEKYAK